MKKNNDFFKLVVLFILILATLTLALVNLVLEVTTATLDHMDFALVVSTVAMAIWAIYLVATNEQY